METEGDDCKGMHKRCERRRMIEREIGKERVVYLPHNSNKDCQHRRHHQNKSFHSIFSHSSYPSFELFWFEIHVLNHNL